MLRQIALSAFALAFVAGCSGGGGSSRSALPQPTPTPTPGGQTSRPVTFTITFSITQSRTKSSAHRRYPKYISPNTGSIGVAVNGGQATYSQVTCNGSTCSASVTVRAPVNQTDTFDVTTWTGPSGPSGGGVLLSEGTASSYITAGGTIVVPVTLGGEVAQIVSVNVTSSSFTSGTSGSATLTVTAKDPSGAVIVGCYASPVPVRIFENDNLQAFSFSSQGVLTEGSVIGSGSTADGCPAQGSSETLYYSGNATGPSFPADAVIGADLPGTQGGALRFFWGQTNQYGLLYNTAGDASTVLTEVNSTCPSGTTACAYYEPILQPFLATITGAGAASSGEAGSPVAWITDNFTGLVGGVDATGAFTLYPTDGAITGPPHSADPNFPNYSVPFDIGGGQVLISNYTSQNLVDFKDGTNSQVFDVLRPAYASAGFAAPVGIAPSAFSPDGSGSLWFVDPNTAAVDQASSSGANVVSCALPFSDGATPVAADALVAGGSTVWASTVATLASGSQQFFIARFPTSIANANPCTVPFSDEIPVPSGVEVDNLALDATGNLWYVDNGENLGYIPAAGGTPVTQSAGLLLSSNLVLTGRYIYGLDSKDSEMVRIDTSSPPPGASIEVAPLPQSWNDVTDDAFSFNQVWIAQGAGNTLLFAGNAAGGLQATTNELFEIDPTQLTYASPARTRSAFIAPRARTHARIARRPRGSARHVPIHRSLPNFGIGS